MNHKKALIAMSGGVDSSVCALWMKQHGYDCLGVTMKLHEETDQKSGAACSASDIADAKNVAETLDIPHCVMDYSDCFADAVSGKCVRADRKSNNCSKGC